MGFRFRRSIRILPFVRLNIGKRSVSTSIGVKGAHITFGKNKTRETVSLPASGLSYTHFHKMQGEPRPEAQPEVPPVHGRYYALGVALLAAFIVWAIAAVYRAQ